MSKSQIGLAECIKWLDSIAVVYNRNGDSFDEPPILQKIRTRLQAAEDMATELHDSMYFFSDIITGDQRRKPGTTEIVDGPICFIAREAISRIKQRLALWTEEEAPS